MPNTDNLNAMLRELIALMDNSRKEGERPLAQAGARIPSENEWIDSAGDFIGRLFKASSYFDPLPVVERQPPVQPMSPEQANFLMSAFAGPGVARQPSQSAAVNTPGRPAIEGPAPLSLEPQPLNPLSMEPNPLEVRSKLRGSYFDPLPVVERQPPVQYTGQPPLAQAGARIPSENDWIDPAGDFIGRLFKASSYFDPLPVVERQPPVQYTGQPPFTPSGQAMFGLSDTGAGAPSQSAAVNTPGRPAIEGPAPLSLEPQPLNPLSMEPNPLEVRPKLREGPFELAELLSLAEEQPVSPEMAQAEPSSGMGNAAKIAMALGGLGLALGLRNQYRKDKGRVGRNTGRMIDLIGRGLGGYTNYKQGEEAKKTAKQMFDDKIRTEILLAMAKQQADALKLEANLGQKRTEETGRDKRAELSARVQVEIAKANLELRSEALSNLNAFRGRTLDIREGERDEAGQGMEMLVLKNLELQALADIDAKKITDNSQLHPALRSVGVTVDGLKRKLAAIARGESYRAMSVPMGVAMGSAIMRSGIINPLQTGPWQPILEPLMKRTEEEGSSDYTED